MTYDDMHKRRYQILMAYCRRFIPNRDSRVLEIGASGFTRALAERYPNLDVLGLAEDRDYFTEFPLAEENFIPFDLSKTQFPELWIETRQYNAIVYAEVIEHLFCPPESSLQFLAEQLLPGGVIVCQTPNGLSLEKRLRMAAGFPPFDRIGAKHFREFSREELYDAGQAASLAVEHHAYHDYFGVRGGVLRKTAGAMLHGAGALIPRLRRGQTIVYRKISPDIGQERIRVS